MAAYLLLQWFDRGEQMRLTSFKVTFGLNVHVAPLPVLFEGAALLVAATAVVALIGLFYCKQEFQLFTNEADDNI